MILDMSYMTSYMILNMELHIGGGAGWLVLCPIGIPYPSLSLGISYWIDVHHISLEDFLSGRCRFVNVEFAGTGLHRH